MSDVARYPYAVDCYLLKARNNLPPHPEDRPVATEIVRSKQDAEQVQKVLKDRYPGGWCVERPLDWERISV